MKVVGLIVEVPKELQGKFLELGRELKEKYGIDLLSQPIGHVLEVFDQVFRPLLQEYQDDKIAVDAIAVKIQEYTERINLLSSVVRYALDRYGTDFREEAFFKVLEHNADGVTRVLQQMAHGGKSLEDAYRYMLSQSIVLFDQGKGVQ